MTPFQPNPTLGEVLDAYPSLAVFWNDLRAQQRLKEWRDMEPKDTNWWESGVVQLSRDLDRAHLCREMLMAGAQ